MKFLAFLLVAGAGLYLVNFERQALQKRQEIARHRVGVAWTQDDVRQSKGVPLSSNVDASGSETWGYPDGTLVDFERGRVSSVRRDRAGRDGIVWISQNSGQYVSPAVPPTVAPVVRYGYSPGAVGTRQPQTSSPACAGGSGRESRPRMGVSNPHPLNPPVSVMRPGRH